MSNEELLDRVSADIAHEHEDHKYDDYEERGGFLGLVDMEIERRDEEEAMGADRENTEMYNQERDRVDERARQLINRQYHGRYQYKSTGNRRTKDSDSRAQESSNGRGI